MEQPNNFEAKHKLDRMTDNIIEFPSQADDLHIEVEFDDDDVVNDVFFALQIMLRGMTAGEHARFEDCVDACIMAASWSAKEAGYTAAELTEVFQSIKVEPLDAE
jgi:hypothetical protein